MNTAIVDQVRAIIAHEHGMWVDEIKPDTHLFDDLDDSLNAVEVYMACEEAFGVEIRDEEMEGLVDARSIAAFIEERMDRKS